LARLVRLARLSGLAALLVLVSLVGASRALAQAPIDQVMDGYRVRVHYARGAESLARRCRDLVATQRGEVERRLAVTLIGPMEVTVTRTRRGYVDAVRRLAGGPPPDWSLAVAVRPFAVAGIDPRSAGAVVIDATRTRPFTDQSLEKVVAHELAHLVLGQAAPGLWRWLDEGLAMWAADERIGVEASQELTLAARAGGLPKIAALTTTFPPHRSRAGLAYLVSLAIVRRVVATRGPGAVGVLLGGMHQGLSCEAAFARAAGRSAPKVEAEVLDELRATRSVLRAFVERAVTTGGVLSIAAIIAIVAFFRYRVWRRRRLREMAEEEGWGPEWGEERRDDERPRILQLPTREDPDP